MLNNIRDGLVGWVLVPVIVAGFVVVGAISTIVIGIGEVLAPQKP